jgi:CheY-like chemotaxis protein
MTRIVSDILDGADATPLGRVLLVEDNQDAAHTLRAILEYWGYEVGVAYTGAEGVEKAESTSPGIVICDIGLPGMDGYAVARALRGNERMRKTRLIALTGYGGDENRDAALSAGFDLHLVKPVRPEVLRERLRSA